MRSLEYACGTSLYTTMIWVTDWPVHYLFFIAYVLEKEVYFLLHNIKRCIQG